MQNKTQGRGYTLLEILIVLAVLAGAVVGVLRLFAMGSVKAATQREQTSISALVDAVRGVYASSPSYAGITMGLVEKQARLDQVLRASGTPISAFGGTLTLAAATVSVPNDAFSIQISQLGTKDCAAIVPALAGQTAQVFTASSGNIQSKLGVVPNGADIAKACAGAFFQKSTGTVTLVYYSPRATGAAARPGPSCAQSCAPQTETQTLTCPTGLVGQINQTRQGTCSAGACPSQVWSAWTTVSSSCAAAPTPPLPIVPTAPTDPAHSCVPRTETRSIGCPQPQLGRISQTQTITCDAAGAHVGAWTTVGDTCLAPPLPCTDGVLTGVDACAAGEFGQVSWFKEMTCTGGGMAIGPKVITGSSCSPIGTCRPSRAPDGQKNVACAAGQFGQIIQTLEKTSTCSSATATPVWGPDTVIGSTGACAACPVPTTETQNVPCPAGQVGLIQQSRSVSYACASAPTSLPAPTYSAWTTTSDTCAVAGCTPSGGGVWSVSVVSMQVGPIGGTPTSTPYDTVTFNPATGIAYMTTAPTTSRFLASGNIVFDLTVGAQTQRYTVACTQGNSELNSPGYHITDECLHTGTVTLNGVTLDVTVDAGGLPQQDYVNGKPAGPVSVQATIAQGGCTAPTPACSGMAGAPQVKISPINLTVDQIGDQGAVAGAYGSTGSKAGWTGSAKAQITYGGQSQSVSVTCTAANNTMGNSAQCVGPATDVTLGGQVFGVNVIVSGPTPSVPTMGQGMYWSANVNVTQTGCVHWITRCNSVITTSAPGNGGVTNMPVTDGKGSELPVYGQVTNSPVQVNDLGNGQSGDGPNGNPWSVFCNITGQVVNNAAVGGAGFGGVINNPGYGNPTNPWGALYSSNTVGNFTGPAPQPSGNYGTYLNQTCTMGQDRLFYTPWSAPGSTYEQVLYVGQSCSVAPMYVWSAATGEPAPPTGCPTAASAKPIGHESTPQALPPPGC